MWQACTRYPAQTVRLHQNRMDQQLFGGLLVTRDERKRRRMWAQLRQPDCFAQRDLMQQPRAAQLPLHLCQRQAGARETWQRHETLGPRAQRLTCLHWNRWRNISWYLDSVRLEMMSDTGQLTR